ncbi:MAG: hypothetical protein DCC58_07695 [Chloroflexi bacterium]|nr:MAG: hypothetical protein DCC58_07695 [Chloroflexota bacterium]
MARSRTRRTAVQFDELSDAVLDIVAHYTALRPSASAFASFEPCATGAGEPAGFQLVICAAADDPDLRDDCSAWERSLRRALAPHARRRTSLACGQARPCHPKRQPVLVR